MKEILKEELAKLRQKFIKKSEKLKTLNELLEKEQEEHQKIEERASRLEKSISAHQLEIKSSEKHCSNLKQKISERKRLNLPEKNQISDLNTFVEASKSIFNAKIFENLDHNSKQAEVLQGRPGELLMDIARISELVFNLKGKITDLQRAEIEIRDSRKAGNLRKNLEIDQEVENYNQNTVKVFYKSWNNNSESCDFPMNDYNGNKITFGELLKNVCRYWGVSEINCVLVDQEMMVWPGSGFVRDEYGSDDKEIWLMLREEANYLKAVKKKESIKNKDDVDSDDNDLSTYRNLEVTQAAEENFQLEKERLENERDKEIENLAIMKARNKNVMNLLIYSLFLVAFTWTLLQFDNVEKIFWTRQGIYNLAFNQNFPVNSSSSISFSTISLFSDFQNYLTEPFVNSIFHDTHYNGDPYTDAERKKVGFSYTKIGPIRFLQKKVEVNTCKQDYSEYLGRDQLQCFKDISDSNEFTDDLNISGFKYSEWLKYESASSPRRVTGLLGSYELKGYVAYFENDLKNQEALEMINLVCDTWIDLKTRLLVISSNFCNYNVDYCISLDIIFEFFAGGAVLASTNLQVFRVNLTWTFYDKLRIGLEIFSGLILLYFLIELVINFKKNGCKKVLSDFWNIIFIFLSIMIFTKHMAVVAYQDLDKIKNFDDKSSEFIDYMEAATIFNVITNFSGINAFIVYIYIMKFLKESKGLMIIWGTLKHALYKLLFFFLVFILVFVGWMLLAYKGFGQFLENYKDIGTTATTLLQMLLGNVNFEEIYQVQPEFAGLFFILFIFLNYFIMLNVFLAIINESYEAVYSKIKSTSENDEMIIIIGILLNAAKYIFFTVPVNLLSCRYCKRRNSHLE